MPSLKRSAFLFSGALLISLVIARWPALPPGDPLRGTFLFLPLLVAGLSEVARQTQRRGGRGLPNKTIQAEVLALGLLAILPFLLRSLGLPLAEELTLSGLLLVLAFHVSVQLKAMRPLLGRRLPSTPSAVFFFLPLLVYLAILPWSTFHRPPDGDEPWYLLITHSLAYDLDAELGNNYERKDWRHFLEREIEPQPGDPRGAEGEIYSRHNKLLPLVLALPYRVAGKVGALAMMAALTAALGWMSLRCARHYFPDHPGEALVAYALVTFAPPLLLYSYQVWSEVPAALLCVAAVDRIRVLEGNKTSPRRRDWLLCGLYIALLPLLKIRFILLAGPLVLLAWWHSGRRKSHLAILLALAALVAGGLLAYNQFVYGNPLKIHTWRDIEVYKYPAVDFLAGLLGLFYDTAFGLFACAPIWMLLLPAAVLLATRRHTLLFDMAVFALPYLLVVAPRREWYGGWSPPFRYAIIALPLLGIALIPLLTRRRGAGARALFAGLTAVTLVFTLLWVTVPGWTYNLAHGRSHLLDHLSDRVGADVARLFPSSVRPRTATWIWPPASLLLVTLAWWYPRRRVRRAELWGLLGLLVAGTAVPVAASALPTRALEFEAPHVRKGGGHLYPDRWVMDRRRFRESWVLREGEQLVAPVVAGGDAVRLILHRQFVQHRSPVLELRILVGETVLVSTRLDEPGIWKENAFGPLPWPNGESVVVSVPAPSEPGPRNGVVLDKLAFEWR